MRTIKFRAWDKKRKIMLPEFDIIDAMTGSTGNVPDNLLFLQYTGLEDRTGREIYEGDICQLYLQEFVGKFEVVWHNSKWLYKVGKDNYFNFSFDSKVIGNIYENPELKEGN